MKENAGEMLHYPHNKWYVVLSGVQSYFHPKPLFGFLLPWYFYMCKNVLKLGSALGQIKFQVVL